MHPAAALKSKLRKATLAGRDAMDEAFRIELSLHAAQHALESGPLSPGQLTAGTIISGFLPIRSEIDPRPLLFGLAQRGARLCLPVVTSKTKIEFREFVRDAPLLASGFGTIGPDENAKVLDPKIMIVPLSVFDDRGGRIGYGAGYYDRAIAKLIDQDISPRLIGMGFGLQEADSVPMEPHDHFLHDVVTETGYRQFNRLAI